jgi:Tol biopolymer transport system component
MFQRVSVLLSIASCLCAPSVAQTTTRVSVDSGGMQSNNESYDPTISVDGRYVAFASRATNLVAGDVNGFIDVFVHDRTTGITTRVSGDGNDNCGTSSVSMSSDGRYVALWSGASDLVPGDTNGAPDVFVHDRVTGITKRVSLSSSDAQGNLSSGHPALSADGRYVAFDSTATNLVPGDTNGFVDVFVRDRVSGTTTLVSVSSGGAQANFDCTAPSISADGRYVAFVSRATNLVPGNTNGHENVYVHDMSSGTTARMSTDSNGTAGDGGSSAPSISSDGRWVAFHSFATNLVPGDTNGSMDVFVHDRVSGTTQLVSVDSSGTQGDHVSANARISSDGRFVAFSSNADNLVPGDTNGFEDVFVHDMLTGTTTRVSVDSSGAQGNLYSSVPSISADGRLVAFWSWDSNLVPGDTNATGDVFVRDGGANASFTPFCFGDGSQAACPCGNTGLPNHGCENSTSTGGATLAGAGVASLSNDSVQLTSASEIASALSIVLQGSSYIAPVSFGDGLRCAGGSLKRLYSKNASGGSITVPQGAEPSISVRSSALGDTIPLGATRVYQVYYRDPNLGFCPCGFNATHAVAIAWGS